MKKEDFAQDTMKREKKERTRKLLRLIQELGIFNERPFIKQEYRNDFVKEIQKIYEGL
jgi:hypothetical protein